MGGTLRFKMGVMAGMARGLAYGKGWRRDGLNGFERLIAAIYGQPDRVPLIMQPYTYAMRLNRLSARTFFSQSRPFIHASFNVARYFEVDFWSPVFDFYNIELEALGQPLIWREESEPDVDTRKPLLPDRESFLKLRPPVPGKSGRMPFVLESYERYSELMGVPPMAYACSPFTMAVLIRGYVNLVRDMRRDPAFVHRLMDFLSMEVVVPWIDKMVERVQPALVVMSDAWASQPNVTTEMVREFCLPYIHKIIAATSSATRTVLDTGSWGERWVKDFREVLDIKMEMMVPGNRFPALRPFFLLVWNEDYEEVGISPLRRYAEEKKVCLMLNFRPNLIEEGPVEAILERVKELLREGAGKGHMVLLLNLVPVGTPPEHLHALVAAVKQWGSYPIAHDLDLLPLKIPEKPPYERWREKEGLLVGEN